jgi:predicted transcriptional regulator
VRLEARTLRMPSDVWDRLDVFAKRETTTPSYAVAMMVAERSGAPGLLRDDVAGGEES